LKRRYIGVNIREADGYFDASMLFKNAVHEKIKSVPTFRDRQPTTHCPIEARMTQMGRSCKVIQKTGKTVLLHPNIPSIAPKWESYRTFQCIYGGG
jgi:hypothetical protein